MKNQKITVQHLLDIGFVDTKTGQYVNYGNWFIRVKDGLLMRYVTSWGQGNINEGWQVAKIITTEFEFLQNTDSLINGLSMISDPKLQEPLL